MAPSSSSFSWEWDGDTQLGNTNTHFCLANKTSPSPTPPALHPTYLTLTLTCPATYQDNLQAHTCSKPSSATPHYSLLTSTMGRRGAYSPVCLGYIVCLGRGWVGVAGLCERRLMYFLFGIGRNGKERDETSGGEGRKGLKGRANGVEHDIRTIIQPLPTLSIRYITRSNRFPPPFST